MSRAFAGPIYSGGGYDPGMTLRDYFAIDAVLSAASYHGGFTDGVIENFHSAFRL